MEGFYSLTGIHALQYSFSLSFTYLKQIRQKKQTTKKHTSSHKYPPPQRRQKTTPMRTIYKTTNIINNLV